MKFEYKSNTDCSRCDDNYLMLNEYGICADCWSKMAAAQRSVLAGDEMRIVTQTVYKYRPGLWTLVGWAYLAGYVGGISGRFSFVPWILSHLHW